MKNVLLNQPFATPFATPPFQQIALSDYKPAFEEAMAESRKEIDEIANNTEQPTFENTIEALSLSGEKLNRISSIFFNLNSAETTDEMQALAKELSPMLTEFSNDVTLNQALFERIKTVKNQQENLDLTTEQHELLRRTYRNFSRNGALLNEKEKEQLREIDKNLSQLRLQFGQNVLTETNDFQLHITNEKDLVGLTESNKNAAKLEAKNAGLEGWVFTLQSPSYVAFMKNSQIRELREKLYKANGAKAFRNNEFNNEKIVLDILKFRAKRSQLLGYKNHADFILTERMAKSDVAVMEFLQDLLVKSKPFADRDVQQLKDYAAKTDGLLDFMPWDHSYYSNKVKKEKYAVSDELLKPYFELNQVIEGVFAIANKLYGINFVPNKTIETYHEDVQVFEVKDTSGETIGVLYADFFPRKGKRPGAWMTSFRDGASLPDYANIPLISIVCNFTKPTQEEPSLLTFNEVTTLFHEFGHALHGLLTQTQYESLAGTNVLRDFVELPSQFMENYCYEPEALELFAKHYQTGEVIPQDLIQKIIDSAQFMEGYQTVRQLSFGLLDMAWHSSNPADIKDVDAFESRAFEGTEVYPKIAGTNMSTSFSHIFQGGYAAGYYSYKWAEVLDADAFDFFKQNGIFNAEIAAKFKALLSAGGTEDPVELYRKFRGQEANPKALLVRAGLVTKD